MSGGKEVILLEGVEILLMGWLLGGVLHGGIELGILLMELLVLLGLVVLL